MTYDEVEAEQVSKYNDANLSILRLHEMWTACRHYVNTGNLIAWKFELDNIWLELYNDVTRKKNHQELKRLNLIYKIKISRAKKRNKLFGALLQRHEFLRRVQDEAGKSGVYVDRDSDLD